MLLSNILLERILLDALLDALPNRGDIKRLPDSVWKRTSALNTWGTNAIEGNTLTEEDVERVVLQGQSVSKSLPDVIETVQHERAFRGLLERLARPIDLVLVQELHHEVFRGLPAYRPGDWRLTNPYIVGTKYRPPRREKVIPRLDAWMQTYAKRRARDEDPFALGAWFHHEFEAIHPFENGNGRVGRLLLNLHFLQCGWPPVHVVPDDRQPYLAGLEAGHLGELARLQGFFEDAMSRSLLDLLDQTGGPTDALRPLRHWEIQAWNPYSAHYLSLRARQGALAAVHASRTAAPTMQKRRPGRPHYVTSERALRMYVNANKS